jgi:hypothetical protein
MPLQLLKMNDIELTTISTIAENLQALSKSQASNEVEVQAFRQHYQAAGI